MPTHQDFELSAVALQAPNSYLIIADSSAGQATGPSTIDPTDAEWRPALAALERDDTDEALLRDLGERLFDALLPGDVEDAYRASMGQSQGKLRLRLTLTQAPKLAALPWEYLYDRQRDIFVGISNDTPLSRFIKPQQVFPPPSPSQEALRLLTVISDPRDPESYGLPSLKAEKELEILDQALRRLKAKNRLEEIEPLHHAVRADISEALREHRPHVLHFIGHGLFKDNQGQLIVEDEDHYALEMSGRTFRELLEGHQETRLVTLNVCQGATRASSDAMVGLGPQLVGRGVPAVVAMQYPITDRAAQSFTREFYRALSHWSPVDVALSQARKAIYMDFGRGYRDWGAPVLFMRDPQGLLFTPPAVTESDGDVSPSLPIPPQEVNPVKLRQVMVEAFDQPSLVMLCSDLSAAYREQNVPDSYGVEYDNLRGSSPPTKILHLIDWHRRHRRMADLVRKVLELRPYLAEELA